jgi:epoxyqueuosine reductase
MNDLLKNEALKHGDRLQIIPSHRIADLKNDIDTFARSEELNGFQKWIVNGLYSYDVPSVDFTVRSVILIALSHPFYADVIFTGNGREYSGKCLVRSDFDAADKYLKTFLEGFGYHAVRAYNLPMKRLGVQSGLSEYGRNNITYIDGMGSNFSLTAYFSDTPCEEDTWRQAVTAKACNSCRACINNCPTGAIRSERFLIDNQKCLSAMNETDDEFPEWLPVSVHHTCYDCLRCQEKCPMNIGHIDKMDGCFVFSEQETGMLLQGESIESFPEGMKQKIFKLGLDEWYSAIPRNIRMLMR